MAMCISIKEPWATLIMFHDKNTENRVWSTAYRGPLVIHASKAPEPWDSIGWDFLLIALGLQNVAFPLTRETKEILRAETHCGDAIGVVDLVGCDLDIRDNKYDVSGQYHFRLANKRQFARPFQMNGQLGIFEISDVLTAKAGVKQ